MKKVMMIAAVAAALVSCQSKGTQNNETTMGAGVMTISEKKQVPAGVTYEGIFPAADGPGIRYTLSMDDASANKEGEYTLVTTYLDAEGSGKHKSFTSKGRKQIVREDAGKGKSAIKLVPDNGEEPVYFLVVNDTTLRLVNDSLQEATSGLNYDIIQVK